MQLGPIKTDADETLNRLKALPLPDEAKPKSSIHFGLIVPPSPFVMPYGWEWAHTAPFEGPSMIAALVKGLGYRLTLLDQRENYDPEELAGKIGDFDVIGISTFGDGFNYVRRACEVIKDKRPDVPIILGGPLVSSHAKLIMENVKADYAAVGEGELTLTEFLDWFAKNKHAKPLADIHGLVWKNANSSVIVNHAREQIRDLDALPFQDFSAWTRFKEGVIPEIFMSYSRGCIGNCTFCYRPFPQLNAKSVERVRREIEYYRQYNYRFAWWSDLTFITDKEYVHRLVDEAWTKHDFRSVIFSRVTGIDAPVLSRLKDQGLDLVLYGMESVSKATLADFRKGISKNAIIDCIQLNRKVGIKIGALFIIGAPTDTPESMQELVEFCEEFKEVTRVKYLSALPGTQNYRKFVAEGLINDERAHLDWLSRERSVEEDIDQPGFIKFTPHLTKEELRKVYRQVNGVIEKRPYDYRHPANLYLDQPDAKFFKRPVYLGETILTADVRIDELKSIERRSIEEARALAHFRARAKRYNSSSNWVTDERLLQRIFTLAKIHGNETVVDLATGTGLVAKLFHGKVKKVIGVDMSTEMTSQVKPHLDELIISPVEAMPIASNSVDLCVCRQGLQFTELDKAITEVVRILKPGSSVVFCHLNAYCDEDEAEAFRIQALRNPARVNFFKPGDLESVLERHGLVVTDTSHYRSRESVRQWIDHGAISEANMAAIRDAYRNASPAFKRHHEVEITDGDIFETMLFLTIRAEKRPRD